MISPLPRFNYFNRLLHFRWLLTAKICKSFQFIVFEHHIKQNLVNLLGKKFASQIIVLPHPIPLIKNSSIKKDKDSNKITIAFIGNTTKVKGFHHFIRITKALCEYQHLQFIACGRQVGPSQINNQTNISNRLQENYVPLPAYHQSLAEADLILILNDPQDYCWIASGTILDAIAFKKPIIGFNSELTKSIYNTNIAGYTFNSYNEIINFLAHLNIEQFKTDSSHFQQLFKQIEKSRAEALDSFTQQILD